MACSPCRIPSSIVYFLRNIRRVLLNRLEVDFLKEKVQDIINRIRPSLQADGGDVELINVSDDGIVQVRLVGACAGCPMSQLTLKNGIERILKEHVPEVVAVEAV